VPRRLLVGVYFEVLSVVSKPEARDDQSRRQASGVIACGKISTPSLFRSEIAQFGILRAGLAAVRLRYAASCKRDCMASIWHARCVTVVQMRGLPA
jgi:hypothetical protein